MSTATEYVAIRGVEAGEKVQLCVRRRIVGDFGHSPQQVVPVVEVVVQLAAGRGRTSTDVIQARPGGTLLATTSAAADTMR